MKNMIKQEKIENYQKNRLNYLKIKREEENLILELVCLQQFG